MITLEKGILNTKIVGLDALFISALKKELSYKDKSQVIARAIAMKRWKRIPKSLQWNGVVHLLKDDTFPTGLLPRVVSFLNERYLPYEIKQLYSPEYPHPIGYKNNITLWKHQEEAINEILKSKSGMVKIGTGGGKALVAAFSIAQLGQLPAILVVHCISLLNQLFNTCKKFLDEPIGYIGNGTVDVQRVNVVSIATICSVLKLKYKKDDEEKLTYTQEQIDSLLDLLKQCKCVIVDELHHAASATYSTLLKNLPNATLRIGLSATPSRQDGADILLEAAFGALIYDKSALALIKEKILCKPKIHFVQYEDSLSKKFPPDKKLTYKKKEDGFATIYRECVVENQHFNRLVAQIALANADMQRPTLISVRQIKHGEAILNEMQQFDSPYSIVLLHGENKGKLGETKTLQEFADKKIQILISTLCDEGVDVPGIVAVVDAGGGRGLKTLQLVGRAIRKSPGKKFAYVYMFIRPYTFLYGHSNDQIEILQTEPEFDLELMQL